MKPWRNYIFVEEVKEESPLTSPVTEDNTKLGEIIDLGPDVKDLEVGQKVEYTTYKMFKLISNKDILVIDDDSIIAYE